MSDILLTRAIIMRHKVDRPQDAVIIEPGDCTQCGPDSPIRRLGEALQCGACGLTMRDSEPEEKTCGVCGQVMDREDAPLSKNCGGDCLNCVQDAEGHIIPEPEVRTDRGTKLCSCGYKWPIWIGSRCPKCKTI